MSDPTKGRGVMICLYPKAGTCLWASSPPHLTLAFCGLVGATDVEEFSLFQAAKRISLYGPVSAFTQGVDTFGPPERPEQVVTLEVTERLQSIRDIVLPFHRSQFMEFRPHITINQGLDLTQTTLGDDRYDHEITFDRVAVHYGDKIAMWRLL